MAQVNLVDGAHYQEGVAMPAAAKAGWEVKRLAGNIGAEVRGLDLEKATHEDAKILSSLMVELGVLFFPEQHNLTEEGHIAFGKLFGQTGAHPNQSHMNNKENNEFYELVGSKRQIADAWHTDLTCEEHPPVASVLRLTRIPPVGGDTMWTNLIAAYEALSPPLQAMVDGLTAYHNANVHGMPEKGTIHPVVRKHPVTGKKLLYVNGNFTKRIVEMSADESKVFLDYLSKWVADPRFTVRYRWNAGDVALWDNRFTQHCVVNDFILEPGQERHAQRVTIQGDTIEAGADAPRWAPFPGRHQEDRMLIKHLRSVGMMPGQAKL